ncbi:MAG: DUF5678 domain-containing protein [Candidatus Marsarchaeota archaeon]|nr:DUF5678 domain-containing protein [Candidatus Marsarchaeota archaeon]
MITKIKALKAFEKNVDWFENHYEELKVKYNGQFVAVKGRRVVGHDENAEELLKRLRKSGEDTRQLLIEPIKDIRYVLRAAA